MIKYIAFIVGMLIVASGTIMGASEKEEINVLRVQLMVFSGRPDPTFFVTDPKVIDELMALVKGLPKHPTFTGKTVALSRLGYRGILVENFSTSAPEIESFIVYRSNVEMRQSKNTGIVQKFRLDVSARLEQRLLELAQTQGAIDEKISKYIKNEK